MLDGVMQPNEWQGAPRADPLAFLTDQPRQGTLDVWLAATPGAGNQLWAAAQVRGIAPVAGDALRCGSAAVTSNRWVSAVAGGIGAGMGAPWFWTASRTVRVWPACRAALSPTSCVCRWLAATAMMSRSAQCRTAALPSPMVSRSSTAWARAPGGRRLAGRFFDGRLARLGRLAVAAAITGDLNGDGVSDVVDVRSSPRAG
ncbi:MAG: hypothetical protein HZY76_01095 [Anaerolineae bacterium]|nr:MAG: hypothetical protein HZY76_01095 [Anaerolineae bacterium]